MSSSILARRALRNHARLRGRDDLNIVPMIDMMVILVFFLIFTAVFSKTHILELNLPAPNSSVPELPEGLQLEVIVRADRIEVADKKTGILRTIPNLPAGADLATLSQFLRAVKSRFPDKTECNVLLELDVPYDMLVQVMDTTRLFTTDDGQWTKYELFPQISVGDAPLTGAAALGVRSSMNIPASSATVVAAGAGR
jgi:biopolymer transport protein ExbD